MVQLGGGGRSPPGQKSAGDEGRDVHQCGSGRSGQGRNGGDLILIDAGDQNGIHLYGETGLDRAFQTLALPGQEKGNAFFGLLPFFLWAGWSLGCELYDRMASVLGWLVVLGIVFCGSARLQSRH